MAKKSKNCGCADNSRLGKVGGQAVLEGVMMKAGSRTVTSCRKEDGSVFVQDGTFVSVRKKHKFLNIPILRGVINFVEMMILSVKTLSASADALEIEDEEGKCEMWLKKHLGIRLTDVIMIIGTVLGVVLSLFLFMYLPNLFSSLIDKYLAKGNLGLWTAVVEGGVKILIFIAYLWLVSFVPDIKRTFMYHGAEHKTIFCYEHGKELTVENVRNEGRFHPRCGTSFLILMVIVSIAVSFFIDPLLFLITQDPGMLDGSRYFAIRMAIKILLIPFIMGLGYELIKLAGKHDNFFTRIISAPGVWLQHITVLEPTDDMIECAILAFTEVIPEEEKVKQSEIVTETDIAAETKAETETETTTEE